MASVSIGEAPNGEVKVSEMDPEVLKRHQQADEYINRMAEVIKPVLKTAITVYGPNSVDACVGGAKIIAGSLPPGYSAAAEIVVESCGTGAKLASAACAGPAVDGCVDRTAGGVKVIAGKSTDTLAGCFAKKEAHQE